jgi:hypothetical protein
MVASLKAKVLVERLIRRQRQSAESDVERSEMSPMPVGGLTSELPIIIVRYRPRIASVMML